MEIGIEHNGCSVWGCGEDGPIPSKRDRAQTLPAPQPPDQTPQREFASSDFSARHNLARGIITLAGFPHFSGLLHYVF